VDTALVILTEDLTVDVDVDVILTLDLLDTPMVDLGPAHFGDITITSIGAVVVVNVSVDIVVNYS